MRVAAVVPAAGSGSRFGSGRNKIWVCVAGRSLLEWSVAAFRNHPAVDLVVVVAAEAERHAVEEACSRIGGVHAVVRGGATRAESVRQGLAALPGDTELVLVHDAARPAVSEVLVTRIIEAASTHGAAVPGLPVADTLKRVGADGQVLSTVDRTDLWAVQTPQGARREWLDRAYQLAGPRAPEATDEASLLESAGYPVHVVPGDPNNVKVTTPEDIQRVIQVLEERHERQMNNEHRPEIRTGFGYDVHRTSPDRRLRLGGVDIPHKQGLLGHSDADVVLHAVCDSLLGAAGLGDIGMLFPDTDPKNQDRASTEFVEEAVRRVRDTGWEIVWLDITLVADEPRIGPYRQAMREAIARAAGIEPDRVNLKATTNEGLGFAGRREGMMCWSVATIRKAPA